MSINRENLASLADVSLVICCGSFVRQTAEHVYRHIQTRYDKYGKYGDDEHARMCIMWTLCQMQAVFVDR